MSPYCTIDIKKAKKANDRMSTNHPNNSASSHMTKTISMHVCLLCRSLALVCPGLRGGQLLVKHWKLDITSHSVQK